MYIGKEPIVWNFQKCDAITVVNGQAAYTLQVSSTNVVPESANHMLVSLNGILQAPVTSFTVSGSTLTFASNLATGDVIDFVILLGNVLDLGVVSDNTISTAKIQDDAVTSAKLSSGKILQVVQVTKTDTFTTTSTSFTDVTGLSASITPISTSNKVLVNASNQVGGSATSRGALKLLRGSTDIYIGDAASSRTRATIFTHPRGGAHVMSSGIIFLDSPSSTSSTTYKIQAEVESGQTLAINRSGDDTDNSGYYRTPSSITLMEVSA